MAFRRANVWAVTSAEVGWKHPAMSAGPKPSMVTFPFHNIID